MNTLWNRISPFLEYGRRRGRNRHLLDMGGRIFHKIVALCKEELRSFYEESILLEQLLFSLEKTDPYLPSFELQIRTLYLFLLLLNEWKTLANPEYKEEHCDFRKRFVTLYNKLLVEVKDKSDQPHHKLVINIVKTLGTMWRLLARVDDGSVGTGTVATMMARRHAKILPVEWRSDAEDYHNNDEYNPMVDYEEDKAEKSILTKFKGLSVDYLEKDKNARSSTRGGSNRWTKQRQMAI